MGKTAVSTAPSLIQAKPAGDVIDKRQADLWEFGRWILTPVASLRLTVTLFALSMILVLAGTLAQRFDGMDTVLANYFRSLYVWVPFQIFLPVSCPVSGGFPFFGGWLMGGALLTNLLAAHAV